MSNYLQYRGRYRAVIADYGLHENEKTGALGVKFWCQTLQYLSQDEWTEYEGYAVQGYYCFIDKAGAVLEENVRRFKEATGWDGNLESIGDGSWSPLNVQIIVKSEQYKGREYFKVQGVYPYDHEFSVGNVTVERTRELMRVYGGAFGSGGSGNAAPVMPERTSHATLNDPPTDPPSEEHESKEPASDDHEKWAWQAIHEKGRAQGMSDHDIDTVFNHMVDDIVAKNDGEAELTVEEWKSVADLDPNTYIPF